MGDTTRVHRLNEGNQPVFEGFLKTEEEINKYMLKDGLSEYHKAKQILTHGDQIQKIAIYHALPKLILERANEKKLLSLVVKQLIGLEPRVLTEAGNSFVIMLREKKSETFQSTNAIGDIFELVLDILRSQHICVIDSWTEVLRQIVIDLPIEQLEKELVSTIYELSTITSTTINKYAAMKIAAVSVQVNRIFPSIYSLNKMLKVKSNTNMENLVKLFSQVNDLDIKKCVVSDILPVLFESTNCNQTVLEVEWFPILSQMIKDASVQKEVRSAAITTLSMSLQFYSRQFQQTFIVPFLLEMLSSIDLDVVILKSLCKQLGLFCFHLSETLNTNSWTTITAFIFSNFENANADVRGSLTYNFPYFFSEFTNNKDGQDRLSKQYSAILTKDKHIPIRITAIKMLPEIVKLISIDEATSSNTKIGFKSIFRTLLSPDKEPSNEIRFEFVQIIPALFTIIAPAITITQPTTTTNIPSQLKGKPPTNTNTTLSAIKSQQNTQQILNSSSVGYVVAQDIASNLLSYLEGNASSPAWRIIESILRILAGHTYLLSDCLERYQSALFTCIYESNFAIKRVAAANLIALVGIQKSMLTQIVEHCMSAFSKGFFKQYGLMNSIQLYKDSVPNIRRKLASLLVSIRKKLSSRTDEDSIQLISEALLHLALDRDTDTARTASEAHRKINELVLDASDDDSNSHGNDGITSLTNASTRTDSDEHILGILDQNYPQSATDVLIVPSRLTTIGSQRAFGIIDPSKQIGGGASSSTRRESSIGSANSKRNIHVKIIQTPQTNTQLKNMIPVPFPTSSSTTASTSSQKSSMKSPKLTGNAAPIVAPPPLNLQSPQVLLNSIQVSSSSQVPGVNVLTSPNNLNVPTYQTSFKGRRNSHNGGTTTTTALTSMAQFDNSLQSYFGINASPQQSKQQASQQQLQPPPRPTLVKPSTASSNHRRTLLNDSSSNNSNTINQESTHGIGSHFVKSEKRSSSLNKFVIPSGLPMGLKAKASMLATSTTAAAGGGNTNGSNGIGFVSGGVSHRKSPSQNLTSSGLQEKGLIVQERRAIFDMNNNNNNSNNINNNNQVGSSNSFRVKISPISSAKLPPKLPQVKRI